MAGETDQGVMFPVAGVDVSTEFQRQPPQTTPVGQNVRAFDVLAERGRGGSRSGLSRFIDATVNGANLIQHLTVVVDPQADALSPSETDVDDIPDPSDGGRNLLTDGSVRLVRRGGNANRHLVPPQKKKDRQQYLFGGQSNSGSAAPVNSVFDATPKLNGYLVVFVTTYQTAFNFPTPVNQTVQVTVTNGTGTNFTQVDGYTRTFTPSGSGPAFDTAGSISCWVLRSTGVAADKTIIVTPDDGAASQIVGAEFSNINVSTPHGPFVANGYDGGAGTVTFLSAGSIPVSSPNSIIFGVFSVQAFSTFTAILDNGFLSPLEPTIVYQLFAELDGASAGTVMSCNVISGPVSTFIAGGITLKK